MTIYMAIDQADGLTLPDGEIVGLTDNLTRLRTNGFDATTYTGNRLAQVDESTNNWNSACQARIVDASDNTIENGWYIVSGAVKPTVPSSELQDLKDACRGWQQQVVAWNEGLILRGIGQHRNKVAQGHDRLYSGSGAVYLYANNTSHSLANRKIFVANMSTGAMDIRKVDDFYTEDTGNFPDVPERGTSGNWFCWVDPASPGDKLNLIDSETITGTIAASVNLLGDEWVAALSG